MLFTLKERDEMSSKKDINRTVRFDSETDGLAVQVAGKLDCNVSQLIRTALFLSIPLIVACPSMLKRLDLDDLDLTTLGL